jgi:hypothetical protein
MKISRRKKREREGQFGAGSYSLQSVGCGAVRDTNNQEDATSLLQRTSGCRRARSIPFHPAPASSNHSLTLGVVGLINK